MIEQQIRQDYINKILVKVGRSDLMDAQIDALELAKFEIMFWANEEDKYYQQRNKPARDPNQLKLDFK